MSSELSWGFSIAMYLFVGGMSAAAYYIGVIADIAGRGRYKDVARIGSYLVIVPIAIGLIVLLLDLGQPLRFWHLLFQTGPLNRGLIFLPVSAMSFGTWVLIVFSLVCGVAYPLMWLAEEKFGKKLPLVSMLSGKDRARRLIGMLGLPFAIMVAVYTGVLLAATARPVWADTPLLPVLFVLSATSTGFAAIMLIMSLKRVGSYDVVVRLEKGDNLMIKMELAFVAILFLALLSSPGAVGLIKNLMFGSYAVFFWLGFILTGLVLPLSLQNLSLQDHSPNTRGLTAMSAALVLFGGFFLRYIVLLAA